MKLAAAALLTFLLLATPASAADVTVREFSATELESLDAYRDHVAWTESSGRGQNQLMTLVNGAAVAIPVKPVEGMDVAAGPNGQPVVVYNRCGKQRCTFYTYDFATGREQVLKGAPAGNWENWSFWRDRFVLIRKGRLVVFPLGGKPRDVGRAKTLADKAIDFNGVAVSYVNQTEPEADVEQYSLAYWPVSGKGRSLLDLRHGLSGDLSMAGAYVSSTLRLRHPALGRVRRPQPALADQAQHRQARLRGAPELRGVGRAARHQAGGRLRLPDQRGR